MAILKPFTFVAGQKAKADEVNQDFDVLYSEVNAIDTRIVDFSAEIETLQTTKANTNGNYANRFAVANPVNSYDAINKQYLEESQGPMRGYIDGLVITKSGNKKILVSAGSCYDETLEHVLVLQDVTEKENTTQSASATYYVYIIAKTNGNEDILISTSSVNPPLPTDYVYYRKLGSYTTDSSNKIDIIDQSATKGTTSAGQIVTMVSPNFSTVISYARSAWHEMTQNGTLVAYAANTNDSQSQYLDIKRGSNGTVQTIEIGGEHGGYSGGHRNSFAILVSKGDYVQGRFTSGTLRLFPSKGGN